MSKRYLITATVAAAAAVAVATLSACGSSGSPAPHRSMSGAAAMSGAASMSSMAGGSATPVGAPATGPHNAADVSFATDMIPHHVQALEMAKMALTQASDPKVRQLAQLIENEQTPEITAMSGWLKGWNEPVPSTSMGGMSMSGTSMPGMMSDADMSELAAATGARFDKLFLSQMITHHTGALTMADTELSKGQNSDTKMLATSIIAGQSREITQMKALLPTIK